MFRFGVFVSILGLFSLFVWFRFRFDFRVGFDFSCIQFSYIRFFRFSFFVFWDQFRFGSSRVDGLRLEA